MIYIDKEFKCHVSDDGTMTAVETDAFNGKCDAYIEGHRFVPDGMTWTRSDGVVFEGEMKSPWKNSAELEATQHEYEMAKLADAENALAILLGGDTV